LKADAAAKAAASAAVEKAKGLSYSPSSLTAAEIVKLFLGCPYKNLSLSKKRLLANSRISRDTIPNIISGLHQERRAWVRLRTLSLLKVCDV
jgi:hypothetical protein